MVKSFPSAQLIIFDMLILSAVVRKKERKKTNGHKQKPVSVDEREGEQERDRNLIQRHDRMERKRTEADRMDGWMRDEQK